MRKLFLLLMLVPASACRSPEPPASSLDLSGLVSGWNQVEPEEELFCANGDPYDFSFRPGSPENIAVILPGGGACTDFDTCDPDEGTYQAGMAGGNLVEQRATGILDFENPRNPIREYSVLFVPYCTGDVYLGDAEMTYEGEDGAERTIPHFGLTYTEEALNWLYRRASSPRRLAVMGMSAGAIGSPLVAGLVADHYPEAKVVQIGDGAGAYGNPGISDAIRLWQGGKLFEEIGWIQPFVSDSTEFVTLYQAVHASFPNVRLHQLNAESDSVQVSFIRMGGVTEVDLPQLLHNNLGRLDSSDPTFRSYTMTGFMHTILVRPEFYDDSRYPTPLVDWVTTALNGGSVESIWMEER